MKTTDQIAAKAWDKICDLTSAGNGSMDDFIAIIKAACEKAYAEGVEHGLIQPSRAAHASEQDKL